MGLEGNITTIAEGPVEVRECRFALTRMNTCIGTAYTSRKALPIGSSNFLLGELWTVSIARRNH